MKTAKNCEFCGLEFGANLRNRSYARQRFCSPQCRNKARAHIPKLNCPVCGSQFLAKATGKGNPRKRFCSSRCASAYRSGKHSGSGRISSADMDLLTFLYPIYGTDAVALMMGIDRGYVERFAHRHGLHILPQTAERLIYDKSRENMTRNNPMKNAESVQKVKDWRTTHPEEVARINEALILGQQKMQKDKPSGLEYRLRNFLDKLGVSYEASAIIKHKFIVDIRIGKLIIEADGDWWHGHSRFEPLNERQIKQQRRDVARNKYLAACGYTVIRIWESDMTKEFVKTLLIAHGIIRC